LRHNRNFNLTTLSELSAAMTTPAPVAPPKVLRATTDTYRSVRFEVPTTVTMVTVIWDVTPCSLEDIFHRFREILCYYLQI
jgi:hypothetical protein